MNRAVTTMALRNLVRHPRRTVLTVAAVAIGLSGLIFLWGFSDGLHSNMISNFQSTIVGSLEVQHPGFFDKPELSRHIADPQEVIDAVDAAGVRHWTRRLAGFALAAGQDTSQGVLLMGLDPEREPQVTVLHRKVTEGRFFESGDQNVCVMGATTARNLGIRLGEPVALLAYDRFGALAAEELTLVGLITSGELGIDKGMVLAPLSTAQRMLEMDGRVTGITLRVPEKRLESVASRLRAALPQDQYQIMRWYDMYPVVKEWVVLHNGFLYVFLGVVLLIVLAGVLNTVLLSTLERTREFGILMALGTKQHQIAALVMTECLLLGLIGVLVGTAAGIAVVAYAGNTGIDLSLLLGSTTRFYVDPVIRTQINLDHLWLSVSAVLAAALCAGVYPAWRASMLEPVEAIRHV